MRDRRVQYSRISIVELVALACESLASGMILAASILSFVATRQWLEKGKPITVESTIESLLWSRTSINVDEQYSLFLRKKFMVRVGSWLFDVSEFFHKMTWVLYFWKWANRNLSHQWWKYCLFARYYLRSIIVKFCFI